MYTVKADGPEFDTDTVVIIGSQAILPPVLRHSPEIDAFPGCTTIWEAPDKAKYPDETPDASEHINALFGDGSQFHETHGFYIDGVAQNTAVLPDDWRTRAIARRIEVDKIEAGKVVKRMVTAIVPSPEDVIVSKLSAPRGEGPLVGPARRLGCRGDRRVARRPIVAIATK